MSDQTELQRDLLYMKAMTDLLDQVLEAWEHQGYTVSILRIAKMILTITSTYIHEKEEALKTRTS